ncbi:MAG: hypothetical protein CR972_01165 [Candidatus Moraniibacteriota bacterium]|nr:MAG: hypothetical protein CR972_01165 [Candidatus Moranbacteria bacterium]
MSTTSAYISPPTLISRKKDIPWCKIIVDHLRLTINNQRMSYTHINAFEQNQIALLLRKGYKQKEIAHIINKTPSAISQEIKRNKDEDGVYRAHHAKKKKRERRITANQRFRRIENDERIEKYITKSLRMHLSPDQISGRLKYVHDISCCANTIYAWIYTKRKLLYSLSYHYSHLAYGITGKCRMRQKLFLKNIPMT